MNVTIHLYTQARPVEIDGARNCYTKGPLYCVLMDDGTAYKFPMEHIFRIIEMPSPEEGPKVNG